MPSSRRPQKSARSSSRPPSRKSEAYENEPPANSRSRRAPKQENIPAMAYVAVGIGALLIIGIGIMIAKGHGEDYSETVKKKQEQAEKKEKEEITLFSINKNKTSSTKNNPENPSNTNTETPSLFADKELEAQRQAEEAKRLAEEKAIKDAEMAKIKEIEEAKKKGEIPEHFDFLPDTSIGDKAKIKTLCEQLIGDNYRHSEEARKQLIAIGIKAVPMLVNTLKEMNVQTDEGGTLGNVVAQTLVDVTGEDMGYEGMGSPMARQTGKTKWIEWWNKERQKHEK